jgi:hypothetical protein
MRNSASRRFYAALGFMVAGWIPGVCIILYDLAQPNRNPITSMLFLLFLYIVVPGFLAAFFGSFFGADILNPDKVKSAWRAAFRGLWVSLAAWFAFAPIVSAVAGRNLNMSFLYRLALVLLFGSVIIGWLVALVGIATGLLLYRFRKPRQAM